jgi:hypothetical protein
MVLRMKRLVSLLLAVHMMFISGCGTLFFHNPQAVRVTSNVPGSLVIAKNEGVLGRMPSLSGEFELDRSRTHWLVVSAHGNEAQVVVCPSHFSWWRFVISLGGDVGLGFFTFFIFPFLAIPVDSLSGSWRVLDAELVVNLVPREEPAGVQEPSFFVEPTRAQRICPICGEPRPVNESVCPHCGLK